MKQEKPLQRADKGEKNCRERKKIYFFSTWAIKEFVVVRKYNTCNGTQFQFSER